MERNRLQIDACLIELSPLRRTPAGIPVVSCKLEHRSKQQEADLVRDVSVELQAIAVGKLADILASARPGMKLSASGFLSAKSLRSRAPILHLNEIEFLEGN